MEKRTLILDDLDLDQDNPRTGHSRDQKEALQQLLLVERFGEKIFALAADICEVGMLDPGERLYVMASERDKTRFTALDGNRRLAALRLLSDPDLIDDPVLSMTPQMQQRFKKLRGANLGRWPNEIDVVVFESRQSAEHFIGVRHKGEGRGAGRSEWSALQIHRFDDSGLWKCVQFLREAGELTQSVLSAVDFGEFAITTFDRVAGGRAFGTRFGPSIGASEFDIGPSRARATKALAILADDVVSGRVTSRDDFARAETTGAYIEEVSKRVDEYLASVASTSGITEESPASSQEQAAAAEEAHASFNDEVASTGSAADTNGKVDEQDKKPATTYGVALAKASVSVPRKPRQSKYLLEKTELIHAKSNAKCAAIIDELKSQVEVAKSPYACALLVRALQELTADIYMSEVAGQSVSTNNSAQITASAKHLMSNMPKKAPSDMRDLLTAFLTSAEVYAELSQVAHNKSMIVSDGHVRASWGSLKGGMGLLWRAIYEKNLPATEP